MQRAVPRLRLPLTGLSPWSLGSDPGAADVRFAVKKWHWARFFSEYFGFTQSLRLRQCSYSSSPTRYSYQKDKGRFLEAYYKPMHVRKIGQLYIEETSTLVYQGYYWLALILTYILHRTLMVITYLNDQYISVPLYIF